ncbi:hypothetical protein AJ78_07968 [Emergomyces pasteurianus Ep9510]|uniref:Uncharacterized protein n=1 Tax=Emergomyces pasteurianus Ep9510 TaxID=1447872 RepID=A0A1J9Q7S5_9EURO|nr:hypothetical protein AJ78_07968 [Emergomyces pasteurianus Ep9510]
MSEQTVHPGFINYAQETEDSPQPFDDDGRGQLGISHQATFLGVNREPQSSSVSTTESVEDNIPDEWQYSIQNSSARLRSNVDDHNMPHNEVVNDGIAMPHDWPLGIHSAFIHHDDNITVAQSESEASSYRSGMPPIQESTSDSPLFVPPEEPYGTDVISPPVSVRKGQGFADGFDGLINWVGGDTPSQQNRRESAQVPPNSSLNEGSNLSGCPPSPYLNPDIAGDSLTDVDPVIHGFLDDSLFEPSSVSADPEIDAAIMQDFMRVIDALPAVDDLNANRIEIEKQWVEFSEGLKRHDILQELRRVADVSINGSYIGVERASRLLQLALNIASPLVFLSIKHSIIHLRKHSESAPPRFGEDLKGMYQCGVWYTEREESSAMSLRLISLSVSEKIDRECGKKGSVELTIQRMSDELSCEDNAASGDIKNRIQNWRRRGLSWA